MLELADALRTAGALGDDVPALNQAQHRTHSLETAASKVRDPAAALAHLRTADRVIQVDDFPADSPPSPAP